MRVLAIIPARGGSKRIPRKNMLSVAGRPLIYYTLNAVLGSKKLDSVVVSSDDEEILAYCRDYPNVTALRRPSHLAADKSPTLGVIRHVLQTLQLLGYIPDAVMTLQPTSPLRTSDHIDSAIELFSQRPELDSLVSCVLVNHSFHPAALMKISSELLHSANTDFNIEAIQDTVYYARNGAAIYLTKYPQCLSYVYGGKIAPYVMNSSDSIDIDTFDDVLIAERLIVAKGL